MNQQITREEIVEELVKSFIAKTDEDFIRVFDFFIENYSFCSKQNEENSINWEEEGF